jgi:hypothetical protein
MKYEIRNTKYEIRGKHEIRNSKFYPPAGGRNSFFSRISTFGILISQVLGIFLICFILHTPYFIPVVHAQTLSSPLPAIDINATPVNGQGGFRLIICDGPALPNQAMITAETTKLGRPYVPCDFNGAMKQVQYLLNVAIIAGVLVAIVGFCYAGYLYIVGGNNPEKRKRANGIFRNVAIGFIIILSSWFIVYQILDWLSGSGFSTLLGSPTN